jgi:hypothetical protein
MKSKITLDLHVIEFFSAFLKKMFPIYVVLESIIPQPPSLQSLHVFQSIQDLYVVNGLESRGHVMKDVLLDFKSCKWALGICF